MQQLATVWVMSPGFKGLPCHTCWLGPLVFLIISWAKRQEPEQALIGSDLIGTLGTGSFLWANWNFSLLGSSAVRAACQWLSWEGLGRQIFKSKWFLSNFPPHLQPSLDFWGTFLIQSYCEPGLTLQTAPRKLIGVWRKWGAQGTIPLPFQWQRQPHFGGISKSGEESVSIIGPAAQQPG